jgi:hypothetical protein
MWSQRTLLALLFGLTALAVSAQTNTLRWPAGAIGLQAGGTDFRVSCGTIAFPCDGATVPLYASGATSRSLAMQVGDGAGPQGLKVSLLGKAGVAPDLGVYGRLGTTVRRGNALAGGTATDAGLSYGVGLSWDLSRGASASLGWDTYDVRSVIGDSRDVRATSLGLQWRY